MKNEVLRDLNFRQLLHYSNGAPQPKHSYTQPLACEGFCVSCEKSGLLDGSDRRLYLMSHGADTSDFESLFGKELPLENGEKYLEAKVMFVLESPGGMYDTGIPQENGIPQNTDPEKTDQGVEGVKKEPPVCHYYWMPKETPVWPSKE